MLLTIEEKAKLIKEIHDGEQKIREVGGVVSDINGYLKGGEKFCSDPLSHRKEPLSEVDVLYKKAVLGGFVNAHQSVSAFIDSCRDDLKAAAEADAAN